jgi:hypothetical protein
VRKPLLVLVLLVVALGGCDNGSKERLESRSGSLSSEAPASPDLRVVFRPEVTREEISAFASELSSVENTTMRASSSTFADYDNRQLLVTYDEAATLEEVAAMQAEFRSSPLVERVEE